MIFSEVKENQTFSRKDSAYIHQKIEECLMIGSKTANAAYTDGLGNVIFCYVKDDEEVGDVSYEQIEFPAIFAEFERTKKNRNDPQR